MLYIFQKNQRHMKKNIGIQNFKRLILEGNIKVGNTVLTYKTNNISPATVDNLAEDSLHIRGISILVVESFLDMTYYN